MRIIPVMDLKDGQVVHAIRGRRDEYRPIRSSLITSSSPGAVATAFRDRLGFRELYVADLDAIAGMQPAWELYRELAGLGLRLIVDAGVRDLTTAGAVRCAAGSGAVVVLGLETVPGPAFIAQVVATIGAESIWFSLDLRHGRPLGNPSVWSTTSPEGIAREVAALGVTKFVVLELTRVGARGGTGTAELCGRLLRDLPRPIELFAGGGIRDAADVRELEEVGVSGVLVATALHDGSALRGALGYFLQAGGPTLPGGSSSGGIDQT